MSSSFRRISSRARNCIGREGRWEILEKENGGCYLEKRESERERERKRERQRQTDRQTDRQKRH